ncbi:MAG: hypothetical protein ACOY3P_20515 [Planctomycetota bacterium]
MLAPAVVAEIRRLLAEDRLSQRAIARQMGISRGTIAAIASGRRVDRVPRPGSDDELLAPQGPPARCPECGGMVYLPCRLCHIRATTEERTLDKEISSDAAGAGRPAALPRVGMRLRPEHHARYLRVRKRKLKLLRRYGESNMEQAAEGAPVVGPSGRDGLGATDQPARPRRSVPGLPSSARNTVGQANRGTHEPDLDRPLKEAADAR